MPVAVIDVVNSSSLVAYYVHADHLMRPLKITDAAQAVTWDAVWKPFGETFSITVAPKLDLGFPGQWTQSENGLAWIWHRHYNPTTGRYTKPAPLRFVDGPSLCAYAGQRPNVLVDPEGLEVVSDSTFGPLRYGDIWDSQIPSFPKAEALLQNSAKERASPSPDRFILRAA